MLQRWLFETPWWLLAAIAIAAVALLISGNNRQDKRLKLAGVGVLLLGVALWAVSYFVHTPREIAVTQTRQSIAAVVARDRATLERLLHPKAVLMGWGRDEILARAGEYADLYGVQSATITSIEGDPADSIVTVTVSVLSQHDTQTASMVSAVPSTWELKWMDTSSGWRLKEILPIRIFQMERSQLPEGLFGN
jgi:hypothetical protein